MLGAVSAQYKVYSGVSPFVNSYARFTYPGTPLTYAAHPVTYATHPVTYATHPVTYAAHPYIHGLPLSFKSAEEKADDEVKPAVEVNWGGIIVGGGYVGRRGHTNGDGERGGERVTPPGNPG